MLNWNFISIGVFMINFKSISKFIFVSLITLFTAAFANPITPAGFYQITDETSNQPSSIVQVETSFGTVSGKVVKVFGNPNAVCSKCSGELKNKPVVGMTILWGFNQSTNGWTSGKVLAVKRGQIYDATIALSDDAQSLILSVKTPLGTKKQVWKKVTFNEN